MSGSSLNSELQRLRYDPRRTRIGSSACVAKPRSISLGPMLFRLRFASMIVSCRAAASALRLTKLAPLEIGTIPC
jgi:hypothetical protein